MKNVKLLPIIIHFIGLILCLAILLFVDSNDHLRWNLGYVILWITVLSAAALPFVKLQNRLCYLIAKTYGIVWLAGSLLLLAFIPIYPSSNQILFPQEKYCKQGDYIVRRGNYSLIDVPTSALFRKQGVLEKHIRDYPILSVDSLTVYEHFGAVLLHGKELVGSDASSAPYSAIFPIDDELYRKHQAELKQIAESASSIIISFE